MTNKQIAALVGLAPLNQDSGKKRGKCSRVLTIVAWLIVRVGVAGITSLVR
jgi:Transposase IS116/IS110/IS902 family